MSEQPFQRICKYTVLLYPLYTKTPKTECAQSAERIWNAFELVRESLLDLNACTDKKATKVNVERTRVLRTMLAVPDSVSSVSITIKGR